MSTRVCLGSAFLVFSTAAQGANFQVRPVSADVPFVLAGDAIYLPQGLTQSTVVTFDILVSNWAPETFRGAQFWKRVTGGTGGGITPYNPACVLGPDCNTLVGPFGDCVSNGCGFGFFETGRADFVFFGSPIVTGSNRDFAGLTTTAGNSASDPGVAKYLGSFKMLVAPNSAGTFFVSCDLTSDRTFWFNRDQTIFAPTLTAAKVTFSSPIVLGIPAVGTWGLVVMVLSLVCAGSVAAIRVRAADLGIR